MLSFKAVSLTIFYLIASFSTSTQAQSNSEDTYLLKNGRILEGTGHGASDPDEWNIQLFETVLHGRNNNCHVVTWQPMCVR